MSQNSYIKLVKGSAVTEINLEQLKERLLHYKEQLAVTGKQLGWEYAEAAFPYTIEANPKGEDHWFYLKGTSSKYKHIVLGIGKEETVEKAEAAQYFIQVVLLDDSTNGDKSKANELCKYLGKTLKAELHMFNGRIMWFNPRK